jgi:hypothetical protein
MHFARHHRTHSQWFCQANRRVDRDYTPEPRRCQVAQLASGSTICEAATHESTVATQE